MFREMRRKNQALPREECLRILNEHENGVLALSGDDGYPYTVPLNHSCMDGNIYFHCAVEGHKLDAIRSCDKATVCVIDADEVDAENATTRYRSVVVFGRVRLLEDENEKRRALIALGARFCPGREEAIMQEINESIHHTGVIELTIEHISGKENKDLARQRRQRA